jgi:hypothetical protein
MPLTEFGHNFHDLTPCTGVQISRGLICQDKTWPINQSPGYGNSLHLTAGNFVGIVILPIQKIHILEQLLEPSLNLPLWSPLECIGQSHVLCHSQNGNQVEELENDAHLVSAIAGEFEVRQQSNILTLDPNAAPVWTVETTD